MEDSIYILAKSQNTSAAIKILVIKNDLVLVNNQSLERNISSFSPMTILVDQNFFIGKESLEVVMLTVDNLDEDSRDVCIMISVQVKFVFL